MNSSGAITINPLQLAIAGALVLVAGLISLAFRLGLEKKLALASARTVVQLLLVGQVLAVIFDLDNWMLVVLLLLIMVAAAGRAAIARPTRTFDGAYPRAFASLALTGIVTTILVTQLIIGVTPWYRPQYVVPLLGMVLGNSLTGISLCLDHLLENLSDRADLVEMELAHGASSWEAAREPVKEAIRRGMIPIINSMMVVGLVSLPGMMTGQILEGADPLEAVKYQIVVMFMLAASTAVGSMLMAFATFRRLFNEEHQLLRHRITKR